MRSRAGHVIRCQRNSAADVASGRFTLRSQLSHQRVCSFLSPVAGAVALVVVVDCSVNQSGLGGSGGVTMVVGSGGSSESVGGRGGSAPGDTGGSGAGAAAGATGSGGTAAGGNAGSSGPAAGNTGAGGGGGGQLGTDDGAAGTGGDGAPTAIGCSDGTREAFADPARFPAIAGCAGGWSVPGLLTEASLAPGCARAAGNDGSNATGTDCTVEDLCADGWHVCRGASELTQMGVTCQDSGIAPVTAAGGAMFFATRQRGTAPTGCSPEATTGSNNLHGCGNFGRAEDPGCAPPLDRQIENTVCASNPPWSCNDPTSTMTEATVATKPGSARGGVLCCR